ncbi:MAG: hypothetical protein IJF04_05845, partial [Oscillospiraceae bacterium]|nr:hypothetical protein [Oscillospiraceae bacterium]
MPFLAQQYKIRLCGFNKHCRFNRKAILLICLKILRNDVIFCYKICLYGKRPFKKQKGGVRMNDEEIIAL